MFRPTLVALALSVAIAGGCSLDRAELHEAGGVVPSAIDDLRVLTYGDDPATDDWVDVVTPDPAVLEEGDAFREDDSRTAADDEAAEERRLFTRVAEGRTVLVQLERESGDLQVWEFVDEDADAPGPISATGIATDDGPNDLDDGDRLAIVREGDAGEATIEVTGDDDVTVERIASHVPSDGVALYVDVHVVTGAGRVTVTYEDDRGTTSYDVVVR